MTPITYTPEQQIAIGAALADLRDSCSDHEFRRFVDIDRCGELRERGNELFGVFGDTAYKLFNCELSDERAAFAYVPVVVDGHLIGEFPEEGRSGVLHLLRCLWRKNSAGSMRAGYPSNWSSTYLSGGWLHTAELAQSNAEIARHIIEEIDDGQTPLTGGGLPGWV